MLNNAVILSGLKVAAVALAMMTVLACGQQADARTMSSHFTVSVMVVIPCIGTGRCAQAQVQTLTSLDQIDSGSPLVQGAAPVLTPLAPAAGLPAGERIDTTGLFGDRPVEIAY